MSIFNKNKNKLQQQAMEYWKEKTELQKKVDELSKYIEPETEVLIDIKGDLEKQLQSLRRDISLLNETLELKNKEIIDLDKTLIEKNKELTYLEDELSYQEFGIYVPIYSCMNSDAYKEKINEVRQEQKAAIKNKTALYYSEEWRLDGSLAKGRAMNNDNMKMALLAFNGECDSLIQKVKFNNIERIESRIRKSAERIDKLNSRNQISITPYYLELKLKEMRLCYEYARKKEDEKEEMRRIREVEREEKQLQKEIEEARKSIQKERSHYENALAKIVDQISLSNGKNITDLLEKKEEIEKHLDKINDDIKDIDYREANKKAGYVYVISNLGSFGENIYKIGMTRRLKPQERVDELGDASVPFRFDVHAMIFSKDASGLEASLHRAFEKNKVNLINGRKEFFNVTLEEIEEVVKKNYDKTVEFIKIPAAQQYRETQLIRHKAADHSNIPYEIKA